jgi:hypothetical protein
MVVSPVVLQFVEAATVTTPLYPTFIENALIVILRFHVHGKAPASKTTESSASGAMSETQF